MKLKHIFLIALMFSFFGLAQCKGGGDKNADNIDFSVIPKKPIVITSDAKFNVTDPSDPSALIAKEVTGPWFFIQPYFKNNSSEFVTIQTIKFTVTAVSATTGLDVVVVKSLDVSQLGTDVFFLSELPPGGEYNSTTVRWYIDGLPKEIDVVSLNYRITAEAVGWVGDHNNPKGIFSKTIYLRPDL
jgi:hypothetical protein